MKSSKISVVASANPCSLHTRTLVSAVVTVALVGAIVGCSDGGNGAAAATNITGQVVKGPTAGSSVCAYAIVGGVRAATTLVPCQTTTATGSYTLPEIGGYSGDILIEATGGTYTDEATKTTKTLSTALQAIVRAGGSITGVITPYSNIAVTQSTGLTSAAFNSAIANIATQAGLGTLNLLTTLPTYASNSTTATNAYAAALGAMSQYMSTNNKALSEAMTAWATPANQAAFQAALNAYASAAGVAAASLPAGFNLAAAAGSTASSTTTGATVTSGTTTAGGGTVASTSLAVVGGAGGFAPLIGTGIKAGTINTINFTGFSGTATQTLSVIVDVAGSEVIYSEGDLTNPTKAPKQWVYSCSGSACTSKINLDVGGKKVTVTNVTLTADSATGATGTVSANGSATYN